MALVCDDYCDFVSFQFGILGQVWYLIVSIPDPCCLSYFVLLALVGALLKFKFSKKTYLIVIKDEIGLNFKMNDSTLFLIGSYAQKLVASY